MIADYFGHGAVEAGTGAAADELEFAFPVGGGGEVLLPRAMQRHPRAVQGARVRVADVTLHAPAGFASGGEERDDGRE